jgi:hypothetical protein
MSVKWRQPGRGENQQAGKEGIMKSTKYCLETRRRGLSEYNRGSWTYSKYTGHIYGVITMKSPCTTNVC